VMTTDLLVINHNPKSHEQNCSWLLFKRPVHA
jgi:hypothetical protein